LEPECNAVPECRKTRLTYFNNGTAAISFEVGTHASLNTSDRVHRISLQKQPETRSCLSWTPEEVEELTGSRHAYSGVNRGPAWSARALIAIILAIVAVALVIWFALGG
jgi:hypothetical protein